ncbi:MAG: DUF547 domain-containing protein [Candidatus Hodarchaeales archaeon]
MVKRKKMVENDGAFKLAILQRWKNEKGLVDYQALKSDQWLEEGCEGMKKIDPSQLDDKEQLAFYLNAYNLLTLKNVLIELEKNPKWKGNLSYISKIKFFYFRKFQLAGKKINLYNLENKIIRKKFKDPRIHFAINCASKSCPVLPNRLFDPETLDEYLDTLTRNFINDKDHILFDGQKKVLYLSPIFKWYKKDFIAKDGVIQFVSEYLEPKTIILKEVKIKYKDYDWKLNSQ